MNVFVRKEGWRFRHVRPKRFGRGWMTTRQVVRVHLGNCRWGLLCNLPVRQRVVHMGAVRRMLMERMGKIAGRDFDVHWIHVRGRRRIRVFQRRLVFVRIIRWISRSTSVFVQRG